MSMSQLSFQWPARASYAPEDFIVAGSNAQASQFCAAWPDGPAFAGLLSGPEASGKTHLAHSWAARTHAAFIAAGALGHAASDALWQGRSHAVLEDIHAITDEAALFHLLRHAETQGVFLLMTARKAAPELPFTLADVRSRLLAAPAAVILAPDEALLKGFLFKCFTDRQLRASDDVMDYLLRRVERSFWAVKTAVEAIEQHGLERKKPITVPLVKSVIG